MQVCNSLQTDIHASTQFFTGRMQCLPPEKKSVNLKSNKCTQGKLMAAHFSNKYGLHNLRNLQVFQERTTTRA